MSDLTPAPVMEPEPETEPARIHVPVIVVDEGPPITPPPPADAGPESERAGGVSVAVAVAEPTIPFVVGPSGGRTGSYFSTGVLPAAASVRTIRVQHGALIKAVGITYEVDDATVVLGMHGGEKGEPDSVDLEPGEYVTKIEGRYGRYVDSLVLHTSLGKSHRFGGRGGTVGYEYQAPQGCEICGFGGSSSDRVDAIGPMYRQLATQVEPGDVDRLVQGPSGGFTGRDFEDPPLSDGERIVGVRVWFGPELEGIGLLYGDREDPRVLGMHGGSSGHYDTFWLKDDEYIIGLSGCYDSVVRGIRILTNRQLSRAFGWENEGASFVFKTSALDGPNPAAYEVVGLHGTEDTWISALGVIYRRRRIIPLA